MANLIACLSLGKGTWAEVMNLINSKQFDNIYLIVNKNYVDKLNVNDGINVVIYDPNSSIELIIETINNALKNHIHGFDVALNLSSGTGKEHMAILSAVLKLGVGIRQVCYINNSIKEI